MKKRRAYDNYLMFNYTLQNILYNPLFPKLRFVPLSLFESFSEITRRFIYDEKGFYCGGKYLSPKGKYGYYYFQLHFFASNPENLYITKLSSKVDYNCKEEDKGQKLLFHSIYFILNFAQKTRFKRLILDLDRSYITNESMILDKEEIIEIFKPISGKTPIIQDNKLVWEI